MSTRPGAGRLARIAGLALLLPALAHAQSKTGTAVGQFLLIEPSARVTAMGNAGSPLEGGLDAAYYNPGAIGSIEQYQVQLNHSAWLEDIAYDYVAVGIPFGKWGNGYASVTSLNSGEIDVRTVSQPLGTGERYEVSDVAIGLGYGRSITDRFMAGIQVSYVQETIYHSSASTFTIGVGTLYQISENGLRIGASLANFGTEQQFDGRDLAVTYDQNPDIHGDNGAIPAQLSTDGFPMPVLFRAGLSLPHQFNRDTRLLVAVEAAHPSDNSESVSIGGELTLRRMLSLRMGWQNAFQEDAEVGLTLGAGIEGDLETVAFALDYAWADHGRLGGTHRFGLGLHF